MHGGDGKRIGNEGRLQTQNSPFQSLIPHVFSLRGRRGRGEKEVEGVGEEAGEEQGVEYGEAYKGRRQGKGTKFSTPALKLPMIYTQGKEEKEVEE